MLLLLCTFILVAFIVLFLFVIFYARICCYIKLFVIQFNFFRTKSKNLSFSDAKHCQLLENTKSEASCSECRSIMSATLCAILYAILCAILYAILCTNMCAILCAKYHSL